MNRQPIYQETTFTDGVDTYFYIPREHVLERTTTKYRNFLKEADYMDLEVGNGLLVARRMLRIDPLVREIAAARDIPLYGKDSEILARINHSDARSIVDALDRKILTTGLMYQVFIPFIKDLAKQGNTEAQATLDEMVTAKAEWLEDVVLNKNTIKIGNTNKQLNLPQTDGRFDRTDMHVFGYPTNVQQNGEFYYWFPRGNKRAAIRDWGSGLGLGLDWGPSIEVDWLGVRVAKNLVV